MRKRDKTERDAAGRETARARPLQQQTTEAAPLTAAYALCQAAGWGAWVAAYCAMAWNVVEIRKSIIVLSYGLYAVYGVVVTEALRQTMRRRGWLQLPLGRMVPRLLAANVLGIAITVGALYGINVRTLHLFETAPHTAFLLVGFTFNTAFLFAVWLAIYLVVYNWRVRRRTELDRLRLELALREAEYRSLSAQVNPHFLFNSLNSLRALIAIDPEKAVVAVTHLAGVLRYSLAANQDAGERTVQLRDELDAVEDYLALEAIRFEDRLSVRRTIDPAALDAAVPRMMVQHLVENAIKHGIARLPGGGEVTIAAQTHAQTVTISVSNPLPGPGVLDRCGTDGTGLRNTQQRLELLYPGSQTAACQVTEQEGAIHALLTLPLALQEDSHARSHRR